VQSNAKIQWLTSESLRKLNGDLALVVKVNGQVVKSYRLQVNGGQPVRLARNHLEVEPHTDFIPTRLIDLSLDGGCDYCMLDLIWVSKGGR
jgi:hypothetical protein